MKWFTKLFQGRYAKPTELKTDNAKRFRKCSSLKEHQKNPDVLVVPEPEGIFALTTFRNFRCDNLNEFIFESEWVFVTREKLEEPRFQKNLTKTEALTNFCKKLSARCGHKKKTMVVVKPPACHCKDLNSEELANSKASYINPFRRFFKTIYSFWKRFWCSIKKCFCKEKQIINIGDQESITNSYLCR